MCSIPISEIDAYLRGMNTQNEACREAVAQFMLNKGFSTGHGDSLADLLLELSWQIDELRKK